MSERYESACNALDTLIDYLKTINIDDFWAFCESLPDIRNEELGREERDRVVKILRELLDQSSPLVVHTIDLDSPEPFAIKETKTYPRKPSHSA